MPRAPTVSDDAILAATIRAMAKHGPVDLTLAHVGAAVGLSPAALVKRFGSKRALLLAVSHRTAAGVADTFAALRAKHASPLAALLEATVDLARETRSAEELAHHLAFLQIDVTDPAFRRPLVTMAKATLAGYTQLLTEAVARRELRGCDPATLARLVDAVVGGSLIAWAVTRGGTAEAHVRADVEALLAPYRPGR